jgi:glyoxylase-like metal-dependent hydrolase (beta-lactamase superfamily II)
MGKEHLKIHRLYNPFACSYLIETAEGLFLVDAGMVGHGREILRKIRQLGRSPLDIRFAFITHGHADHFGGLAEVYEAADGFPVLVHRSHAQVVEHGDIIMSPGRNGFFQFYINAAQLALPWLNLRGVSRVIPVDDGTRLDDFGLPSRVIHLPGHSEGDIVLLLDSGEAFVGDVVQGRRALFMRPELPSMALRFDALEGTWKKLLAERTGKIYPAHGAISSPRSLRAFLRRREQEISPSVS